MLSVGSRIGSYEVVGVLGAGGMGEVYRARDARLGREVAVKVLPEELARDRDRLARFQQEAQAAGMLNHPNLLTIHEMGVEAERPYMVSELLEGMTLRERLSSGPIPQRKAADYALQIAEGLAAAHEKGIVHRDLKPENIFITRDGRVKILDFGLAKLRLKPSEVRGSEVTVQQQTDPGTVLGSAGYMSPEQVRGAPVDHRSDIFALGVMLYEMLTGRRAFKGPSSVETMNAILNADPPEVTGINAQVSAALQRIVNHCLEKNPEERFQSARDLAFDLESLSDVTSTTRAIAARGKRRLSPLVITAVALLAIAGAFVIGRRTGRVSPPQFHRVTFHSAEIREAYFAPDGASVVYDMLGDNPDLLVARTDSPGVRFLGVGRSHLLAMSPGGELAILKDFTNGLLSIGTLARMPLSGGAPREIAGDVSFAAWNPKGDELAVVRGPLGNQRLEWPIGTAIYSTGGWLSHVRISPDGIKAAVIEHPVINDDGGHVLLLDKKGKRQVLTTDYSSIFGLAWTPDGTQIDYTAAESGAARRLWGIRPGDAPNLIAAAPGLLELCDIAKDGRVLLIERDQRIRLFARPPGETIVRELSWLDQSSVKDLSNDGRVVLFDEGGEGSPGSYSTYIRKTDGSPAVRLGDGVAQSLSPDGQWVIAASLHPEPPQLFLFPTGAGESRQLTHDALSHQSAVWLPDGRHIAFAGHEPKEKNRIYVMDTAGGTPRPISPEGIGTILVPSPDGRFIYARAPDKGGAIYPLAGGPARSIPQLTAPAAVIRWSNDGRSLIYMRNGETPIRLYKFDLASGHSETWQELALTTDLGAARARVTDDGQAYAVSFFSLTGDLYTVDAR